MPKPKLPEERPLLALVMIVKDEVRSIRRTIESVRPIIDCYTILDTGSTDETLAVALDAFGPIPGTIVHEPFVDFATTRNRALELAEHDSVFAVMLSGDEVLRNHSGLRDFLESMRTARYGAHEVACELGEERFMSTRITRCGGDFRYVGVTHEVMVGNVLGPAAPCTIYHDVSERSWESQRAKWKRDVVLLSNALEERPDDARSCFYLAQSYEMLRNWPLALEYYEKRLTMRGFYEEVFESLCRIARILLEQRAPWGECLEAFLRAHAQAPHRAEPLVEVARHYIEQGDRALARLFLARACELPYPNEDRLFVNQTVYRERWSMLAQVAWRLGDQVGALKALDLGLREYPDDLELAAVLPQYRPRKGSFDTDLEDLRRRLGDVKVVVSLTTIPSRVEVLRKTLASIIAQRFVPDLIVLCLPHESTREGTAYVVPDWLPKQVTVVRTDDYGPATKLLGALESLSVPEDTIIVTIDDDIEYEPHVLERLVDAALRHPTAAVGFAGWNVERLLYEYNYEFLYEEHGALPTESRRVNVLEGYRGVAYRRGFFPAEHPADAVILSSPAVDGFFVDDVVLSGYLAEHGTPRVVARFCEPALTPHEVWQVVWRQNGLTFESNAVSLVPQFRSINRRVAMTYERAQLGIWRRDAVTRHDHDSLSPDEHRTREKPLRYMEAALRLLGEPLAVKVIVEVGSSRQPLQHELLDASHDCCGDGHSTHVWAASGARVVSVDIDPAHTEVVRRQLPQVQAVTADGIEFLRDYDGRIDLLFLDAWDVAKGEPYAERHLEAFEAAKDKLAEHHLVVVDDTDIAQGGKGRLLVPYLVERGYHVLAAGRQTIMSSKAVSSEVVERIFAECYRGGAWGGGSGPGSTPEYTESYRELLEHFMFTESVRSVLDLGCGDWGFSHLINWAWQKYVGVDVVQRLVLDNAERYGAEDLRTFVHADILDYPLDGVDLVLVKDVLQHWPNRDIRSFVERLQKSNARFALITNCVSGGSINTDIGHGNFRPLDLTAPPFAYDMEEVLRFHTKSVLLWRNPQFVHM